MPITALALSAMLAGGAVADNDLIAFLSIQPEGGVEQSTANLLSEILLAELQRIHRKVMGGSDMASMLEADAMRTSLGCQETSCLAEVGMALGARYLVGATLGRIGKSYVFAIKLIDTDKIEVVKRVTRAGAMSDDQLINMVRPAVEELMGHEPSRAPAKVAASSSAPAEPPPDATVTASAGASSKRTLAKSGFIGGGLALAAGLTFGYLARRDATTLSDYGVPTADEVASYNDTRSSGKRNALLADVGLGLGIVGLGIGLWAHLTDRTPGAERATLLVGPRHIGLAFHY